VSKKLWRWLKLLKLSRLLVLEEQVNRLRAKGQRATMQREKKQLVMELHRKKERPQQEMKIQVLRELLQQLATMNHRLLHNRYWR